MAQPQENFRPIPPDQEFFSATPHSPEPTDLFVYQKPDGSTGAQQPLDSGSTQQDHEPTGKDVLRTIYGEKAIFIEDYDPLKRVGTLTLTNEMCDRSQQPSPTDEYTNVDTDSARAVVRASQERVVGHFAEDSGLPQVFPGRLQLRAAVGALGRIAQEHLGDDADVQVLLVGSIQFSPLPIGADKEAFVKTTLQQPLDEAPLFGDILFANALFGEEGKVPTVISGIAARIVSRATLAHQPYPDMLLEAGAQTAVIPKIREGNVGTFESTGQLRFNEYPVEPGDVLEFRDEDPRIPPDGKRLFAIDSSVFNTTKHQGLAGMDGLTGKVMAIASAKRVLPKLLAS